VNPREPEKASPSLVQRVEALEEAMQKMQAQRGAAKRQLRRRQKAA